jgi:ferredoxin
MGTIRFWRQNGATQASISTDFCEPQLNLLAHAQALEIGIGSRCGGHGICGGDRIRIQVRSGQEQSQPLSAPTEAEQAHLSPDELAQGWRLACQCYPNEKGLHLEVEALIES